MNKELETIALTHCDYTKPYNEVMSSEYQLMVEENFEQATTYKVIKEQCNVGSKRYRELGVRVTNVINPTTGQHIGDEYKKIIFKNVNHPKGLGYMYKFDNKVWLTVNTATKTNMSAHSIVRMCNNKLKWVDENNKLICFDCVFSNQTDFKIDYGLRGLPQVSGEITILIQRNRHTDKIGYNNRFILDKQAYKITQINNHISDTYMILVMTQTQIQPSDDLDNNIATAINIPTNKDDIKVLPNVINLLEGQSQTYTVYNYVETEPLANSFTITASGIPQEHYNLLATNNGFTVTAITSHSKPLVIECEDNITGGKKQFNIMITRGW